MWALETEAWIQVFGWLPPKQAPWAGSSSPSASVSSSVEWEHSAFSSSVGIK